MKGHRYAWISLAEGDPEAADDKRLCDKHESGRHPFRTFTLATW